MLRSRLTRTYFEVRANELMLGVWVKGMFYTLARGRLGLPCTEMGSLWEELVWQGKQESGFKHANFEMPVKQLSGEGKQAVQIRRGQN